MVEELSSEQYEKLVGNLDSNKTQQLKHIITNILMCSQPNSIRQGVAVFHDPDTGRLDFFSVNANEEEAYNLIADLMAAKMTAKLMDAHVGPMQ